MVQQPIPELLQQCRGGGEDDETRGRLTVGSLDASGKGCCLSVLAVTPLPTYQFANSEC